MENKRGVDLIGAIVVFFVLLFVYTKFLGPIPFSVNNINTNKSDLFQTQGTGKAAAAPDQAIINLGITKNSSSVLEAKEKTNQAAKKIINGLKSLGISEKDIKTTNYSINPNYSFSENTQKITGYSVSQNFEVKVPIEKTNQAIDSAAENGANLVGNISFTLNDEKRLELENKARREAVEIAKKKAQGLSKASGIRLGKIINVSESFGDFPRPILLGSDKAQGSAENQTTNITPGETSVEISVTLTYETN